MSDARTERRGGLPANDIHPPNVFSNEVSDIQCRYKCNEGGGRGAKSARIGGG